MTQGNNQTLSCSTFASGPSNHSCHLKGLRLLARAPYSLASASSCSAVNSASAWAACFWGGESGACCCQDAKASQVLQDAVRLLHCRPLFGILVEAAIHQIRNGFGCLRLLDIPHVSPHRNFRRANFPKHHAKAAARHIGLRVDAALSVFRGHFSCFDVSQVQSLKHANADSSF